MSIWQIKDQYGNVRLEYLDEAKAKEICVAVNAMARDNIYTVFELKGD